MCMVNRSPGLRRRPSVSLPGIAKASPEAGIFVSWLPTADVVHWSQPWLAHRTVPHARS